MTENRKMIHREFLTSDIITINVPDAEYQQTTKTKCIKCKNPVNLKFMIIVIILVNFWMQHTVFAM